MIRPNRTARSAIPVFWVLFSLFPAPGFSQQAKDSASVFGFLKDVAVSSRPGGVRVELAGEGLPPDFRSFTLAQPPRLVLDFTGVLSSFPKKFLEADQPLLKDIRIGQHPDKLRVVLTFPGSALPPHRIIREEGGVTIFIGKIEEEPARETTTAPEALPEKSPREQPPTPAPLPPPKEPDVKKPSAPERPEREKPAERVYSGEKITLDFVEADIRRVFALISEAAGRPIVPAAGVQGAVTLRLVEIPWDQALDAILSVYNLRREDEGPLIRILPGQ